MMGAAPPMAVQRTADQGGGYNVTRRPKLACRACSGELGSGHPGSAPERLIKGGLPTERLVAHVMDAKYDWHLPLYRQTQMMATHGIAIDRSTLAFWVGYAGAELAPVYDLLQPRSVFARLGQRKLN